jgi:hypothetical protein
MTKDVRHELKDHLGERNYEPGQLVWHTERAAQVLPRHASLQAFQDSKDALYFYAARELAPWWREHVRFARETLPVGARVLDYYAATGLTGLRLRPEWEVAFADYQTKCSGFLSKRLKARKLKGALYEIGAETPHFDALVCYDGIERHPPGEQWEFIEHLAGMAGTVLLDLNGRDRSGLGVYYQVNAAGLVARIRERYNLLRYQVVNATVHFVAFGTGTTEAAPDEPDAEQDSLEEE